MRNREFEKQRRLNVETLEQRLLLAADPIITEFLASNDDGLLDGYGNSSDWIEIYNAGDMAIDLQGWHLTDDAGTLDKWTFPDLPEAELNPGEYMVVFASGLGTPDLADNLHTSFSLSAAGEYVGLVRPDLSVASEFGVGGTDYPEQRTDISYGFQGAPPPTAAGITYYDADEAPGGNTAGLFGGWVPRGAGAGDGSTNFGNEGGTLQANAAVNEIVTTASGLDVNQTYDVFAFFWDATSADDWNIQAGLSSGALTDFVPSSPDVFVVDNTTQFPGSDQLVSGLNVLGDNGDDYTDWIDGNRILYGALLGQVGGSTSASVYVDHNSALSARTFYDGIGLRPTGNLVERESLAEYLIPTNGALGTTWTSNTFDAAANGFLRGLASIGYEKNPSADDSFDEEILTNVSPGSSDPRPTSVYVRTEFNINDASEVTGLLLKMKYDDGFVAYLNGVQVASQFAPANPVYNSVAEDTNGRSDFESLEYQDFSLTAFVDELVDGQNTLAIHALNRFSGSTDFLMSPQLTLSTGSLNLNDIRYLTTPTPGTLNGTGVEGFVGDTTFSVDRGFYDSPFSVEIATPSTPTADIYYTFDGSVPGPANPNATLYAGPVSISTTTNLRAAGHIEGFEPSNVDTQTYVFLEDVFEQDPLGNPQHGVTYPTTWQGGFSADYTIDPRVVTQWDDNDPADPTDFGIREGLMSLPTISLTLPHEDLWGTGSNGSGGIYPNSTSEGNAWRRAGSVEYFDPATGDEFQYNAGITIQGAASRDNARLKKHSFRLIFNNDFEGPTKLRFPLFDNSDFDDINTVSLKASFTDSFATRTVTNRYSPLDSTYTRDVWMRDTQLAMGNPVADSTYAHLYINGLYWGLYWPTERNDDQFLASRIGGEPEDWDIVRDFNELFRGQRTAYDQMFALSRQIDSASASNANNLFQEIQGNNPDGTNDPATDALLDVDNFIDYMILHLYGGVEDWPSHNWYAARNRVDPGKGFIFMTWDQEISLDQLFRDRTGASNGNTPGELFQNLRNSSEFRLRFADRVQKNLFNDGALTTEAGQARWLSRASQVEAAIIGESARWGDAREGQVVTPYTSSGPVAAQITPGSKVIPLITVDHWRESIDYVHDTFLPNAGNLLINRLLADNLYTALDAPVFQIGGSSQHGGVVSAGSSLSMNSSATVYFTTDGTDPRDVGGAISGTQFTAPLSIDTTTIIKARTFSGGQWSALSEATFTVTDDLLAITEINFNPYAPTTPAELAIPGIDNDDFEFIEIMNTSLTNTINLNGTQLTDAVSYTFGNVTLGPGERVLVVEDTNAFTARYGSGLNVVGQWSGGLSNNSEEIIVLNNVGAEIFSIAYNDSDPWAVSADGAGATLVLDDPLNTPANQRDKYYRWRGSVEFGGTPGVASNLTTDQDRVVINEVLAHTDLPQIDAIELFNPTDTDVDVSGWTLSDADDNLQKFTIPTGTILASGGYLVFDENDFNTGVTAFALDADGDQVYLTRPDGSGGLLFVDQVDFGASLNGESFGRVPNGTGRLAPMIATTFDAANSAARIGEVIVSEVNYHPENPSTAAQNAFQAIAGNAVSLIDNDLEFVEIHNSGATTANLTTWRLRGESDFDFPAGTMLASGESLLVVTFDPTTDAARLAGFVEHYGLGGSGIVLLGGSDGNLNNGFGRVSLQQPDIGTVITHVLADEVLYDDLAPWPTGAGGPDGLGQSLHRQSPTLYGNNSASWLGATPSPGVAEFVLPDSADFNGDGIVSGSDFLTWQIGFGTTAPNGAKSDGDADNDFDVDADDLSIWISQYGSTTPLAAAQSTSSFSSEQVQTIGIATTAAEIVGAGEAVFLSPSDVTLLFGRYDEGSVGIFEDQNTDLDYQTQGTASDGLAQISSVSENGSNAVVDAVFEQPETDESKTHEIEWLEELFPEL